MAHRGLLIVVSGPSGTGKGTVIRALKANNNKIMHLPSATTRTPRQGEKDGVNYYFKTREEFLLMVERDELVEWTEYCGNLYGTPEKQLNDVLDEGINIVLEKEVEGALNIKVKYPESIIIFILPPSFEELRRRIVKRGTESKEFIEKRLMRAIEELKYSEKYDYVVVNDFVEIAANSLNCIIHAEKLRTNRNMDIIKQIIDANIIRI